MEPELSLAALLEAVTALTATVGSLQDQIRTQGQQLVELKAICKETANLVGNKDQGSTQAKPGPSTGPITPPTHLGGEAHTPGTVRPGLKALFCPSRGTGFDSEEEEEPRRAPKKEPCNMPRSLSSLTPFNSGSSVKQPKMELPDPYKGDTRGCKATQWLDCMLLWVALHRDQFDEEEQMVVWILYHMTDKAANWVLPLIGAIIKGKGNPPTTILALMAKFKEAFANANAKRVAARKIAALTQTTTMSEYVTKFCNLIAELDWNKEAYIAQFMCSTFPHAVSTIPSTRSGVPHPYSRPSSRSSQRSVATRSQPPSCGPSPPPQHLPGMEPEPTTAALLKAILNLTNQVRSLQAQISSQGQQLAELKAICKETNNLVGDKDQGGAQTKPGPSTGPVTPPTHSGGEAHTPEDKEPRPPKKEPQGTPRRHLGSLTPFDAGSSVKQPKMDLPTPTRFDKEEQMVVWILYHMTDKAADWALPIIGSIIKGEGNPPTTIQALTAKFKEAFANPDAKRAAARKIAVLSQSTTTSEYVMEFRNLMAELDWNKEAYVAIPDDLKAIFAATIKIDNICRENEENRPKKVPAKSLATTATTSTTTTRVRLSEDPNYVTPEERDRCRASGLCVKCGQKGHGIKQCPNGWKATIKEVAKVAEEESGKE
ncbi:Retrotransposon gag protein [Rhizoctonia solani]|uniref:Retrotransposon gag protein n=1 Tax=Rhizoctonia solani TaxID=456999 RepID=A0A8H8SRF7_9AGAM|nr:Retrotransposon gag protein [Rhizoctonia solani]QRW15549.1 Retrotransposon gag protein [Rhizoctonia solani]